MSRGPWRRLVLATEEMVGTVTLDRPLAAERGGGRTALLTAAGRALARWHHAGLVHPDLNLGNILIRLPAHRDRRKPQGEQECQRRGGSSGEPWRGRQAADKQPLKGLMMFPAELPYP